MLLLTVETFDAEVVIPDRRCLVLFAPKWSTKGNRIQQEMELLQLSNVSVYRVDLDEQPELAMRFSIRFSPSLIYFVSGVAMMLDTTLSDTLKVAME